MTKNDNKHIQAALASGDVRLAARAIAAVHRSGSARTQVECERMIDDHGLRALVRSVNGCLVEARV